MRLLNTKLFVLLTCGISLASVTAHGQSGYYDIKSAGGDYSYNVMQVPGNLSGLNTITGSPAYQWQVSDLPLSGFTNISGATAATLSFSTLRDKTRYYRRIVTIEYQ